MSFSFSVFLRVPWAISYSGFLHFFKVNFPLSYTPWNRSSGEFRLGLLEFFNETQKRCLPDLRCYPNESSVSNSLNSSLCLFLSCPRERKTSTDVGLTSAGKHQDYPFLIASQELGQHHKDVNYVPVSGMAVCTSPFEKINVKTGNASMLSLWQKRDVNHRKNKRIITGFFKSNEKAEKTMT